MEVVWISGDEDEEEFDDYFAEMPWLAVPFEGEIDRDDISETFNVEFLPTLLVLKADGSVDKEKVNSDVLDSLSAAECLQKWSS